MGRILFLPGGEISETCLPPADQFLDGGEGGGTYYSSRALLIKRIARHHPVFLTSRGRSDPPRPLACSLRIGDFEAEGRGERSSRLSEALLKTDAVFKMGNAGRILDCIPKSIERVFDDKFPKSMGGGSTAPAGPLLEISRTPHGAPRYPLAAGSEQREGWASSWRTNAWARDGRRNSLSKVHRPDARALFQYLALEDGRRPRGRNFSCEAPLTGAGGARHFVGKNR